MKHDNLSVYTKFMCSTTTYMTQDLLWKADSYSASPEISCLLWNSTTHYRVH